MNHVLCDGGLSNRLNALVFALILKRRFGGEWRIAWPVNNWCGAPFEKLFDCDLAHDDRSIESFKLNEHRHLMLMHENQIGFDPARLVINRTLNGYDDYQRVLASHDSVVYYNSLLPGFVSDAEVNDALQLLRPGAEVARRASEFVYRHGIDATWAGLHIRKSDFGDAVNDQAWFEQAKASARRIFVCSDDAEVNRRFAALPNCAVFDKTAFPEKLDGGANWQHWTQDAEGRRFPFNITRSGASVLEGFIDQLILSQTEVITTSGSTFQAMAGLFGRCGWFQPAAPAAASHRLDDNTPRKAPMSDKPVTQQELFDLLNLLRPWQMISDTKVRIGSDADGGYVLPSSSRRTKAVLSIGIGNEVSFDADLARLGARVIQFDHTIEGAPLVHPNIEFHRKGWGANDEHDFVSLSSMVKMIDWNTAQNAILKFDTEGAEWSCLGAASSEDLDRFEVVTGEFHGFDNLVNRDYFDTVHRIFTKLNQTHRVIHMHANNAGGMIMLGGIPFPRLLELTFIRKRTTSFHGHSSEPIPGPLDRPNVPQLPDLYLRAF